MGHSKYSTFQLFYCPFSDEEVQFSLINQFGRDALKAKNIAPLAEGNLNKGLKLVDEMSNDNHMIFRNWMRHSFSTDFSQLIRFSEEFQKLLDKDRIRKVELHSIII